MKTEDDIKTQVSVLSQLTEALYHGIPTSVTALFLMGSIISWLLYDVIKKEILLSWYFGFCVVLILRLILFIWYNRTKLEIRLQRYHYYLFILTSSLTALFLGILGSVMMPENIVYQSFIIILVTGVIAGSIQSLAASFFANITYMYMALFPMLIWEYIQIIETHEIYMSIFAAMVVFCVFSFITARREHLMLTKHIELEYNYKTLLKEVSKMKDVYKEQAYHDPLTGIYNRNFLNEYLDVEIAMTIRKSVSMAVIMLDIDHFKDFNDRYGHECGDEILQAVGNKIIHSIRKSDVVCRYGGEEFIIILPDSSLEGAIQVAEVLRKAIKTVEIQKNGTHISDIKASVGVAIFPKHGLNKQEIIEAADKALYRAKAEGRDRVCSA